VADEFETGADFVCFDSTALIAFNVVEQLDVLGSWFPKAFAPNVVLTEEVGGHLERYPDGQRILDAPWLHEASVEDAEGLTLVAYLLNDRWNSPSGKDRGEAEVIALCRRYGWVAVLDDAEGIRAAEDYGVSSVSFLSVILAAAAQDMIKPGDAWELHVLIDQERRKRAAEQGAKTQSFSFLTSDSSQREVFMACVRAFRKAWIDQGREDWPGLLSTETPRPLDKIIKVLRKQTWN
jgi:predicted nucleic acid-binding protein